VSRFDALDAVHDGERHGNAVAYVRMEGTMPPPSRR
jgi:hypothetical protein